MKLKSEKLLEEREEKDDIKRVAKDKQITHGRVCVCERERVSLRERDGKIWIRL